MIIRRRRDKRIWYVMAGVFVAVFLFSFLTQKFKVNDTAGAANLSAFDPGYIISDYQMGNYNSMSEAEIQAFLTAKNPCSNTDHGYYQRLSGNYNYKWHFENGHFICLSEERFGDNDNEIGFQYGESAAHIIWQAAQDYKINPQALLVLLQKETGLITDPIPNNGDYRKATGYGCPDTAACSSKYYGFKNQVRNAASLYRYVLDNGSRYYPVGNNYVQYNPNSGCGGSVVNIKNRATSALYQYTPYQPNSSALGAGYGAGDACASYGNRNFYLYFEDWFGGATNTKAEWENMSFPRVMTIDRSTLIIDAKNHNTTTVWAEKGENYYFTKKTSIFWGGEKQVCLQRKVDEGTDKCILMARATGFSLNQSANSIPKNEYEIITSTCIFDIVYQSAECGKKSYSKGQILEFDRQVEIEGVTYMIESGRNDGFAVLKPRTRRKVYYEKIDKTRAVLMRLVKNSNKYIAGEDIKVQSLSTNEHRLIFIMDKTTVDGEKYYRTLHDYDNDNNYLIPQDALSDNIFIDFMYPRNMTIKKNTASIDLESNKECKKYKAGDVKKYIHKTEYAGDVYYQSEEDENNKCVIKSSDLGEAIYNFNNSTDIKNKFSNFLYPRNLRVRNSGFAINIVNGTTCDEYLSTGDVQRYTTKIVIGGVVFFRTEKNTENNSTCAVPSTNLQEVN